MAKGRTSRVWRLLTAWTVPVLTIAIVAAVGVGAYRLGYLNETICAGACDSSFVEPPHKIADISAASVTIRDSNVGPAAGDKVKKAVDGALGSGALGSRVGFTAIDLESGVQLWSTREAALIPASTNKIFTTFAALSSMDPEQRFDTTVRLDEPSHLVLVGGGDPYLGMKAGRKGDYPKTASLATLAIKTAKAMRKRDRTSVTLSYDQSLFSGPAASNDWEASYVREDIVTPISALWVDQGVDRGLRFDDPARSAAQKFAAELAKHDIDVSGSIEAGSAPAAAPTLASVQSPTLGQIVELINQRSDNEAAEVLFRHVALASGREGSFAGGSRAVTDILRTADIDMSDTQIHDGSGLSRRDRTTTKTLARTLYVASQHQRTEALLASLPVAGFNGSLRNRFGGDDRALGLTRAKTGTLTGVQGLAGVAVDAAGRGIIFAALANGGGNLFEGRAAIEAVAEALSDCRCG